MNRVMILIMHILRNFWVLGAISIVTQWLPEVKFWLRPDGNAQSVGVLLEPAMKRDLIWWGRTEDSRWNTYSFS